MGQYHSIRISYSFLLSKNNPPICQTCGVTIKVRQPTKCSMYMKELEESKIPNTLDEVFGPNPETNQNI